MSPVLVMEWCFAALIVLGTLTVFGFVAAGIGAWVWVMLTGPKEKKPKRGGSDV